MRRPRAGAHEPAAAEGSARDLPLVAHASRHDRWRDWRTYVRAAGAVSALLGLVVLASVAYQLWGTGIVEARAQHDLRHRFNEMLSSTVPPTSRAGTSIARASMASPTGAIPGVSSSADAAPLPLAQTTEPPPTLPAPDEPSPHPEIKDGAPVARLEIPAIDVDQVVVSGVLSNDLSHGPGHYPATPLPGEVGNAGIAGHRTTYGSPFADLDKLQPGDGIIVTTTAGRFFFAVTGSKIVEPSDASVLAPTTDVRLTLTTCHPRYSTARRLVVTAVLAPEPRKEPVATTAPAPATTPPPVAPAATAAPATTNAPATTVPVTTVPAPTTSGVTAVTTPVTASPTTPATTTAPTTVPATTAGAEQQVNDAYLARWPRYWVCLRKPGSCAPDELTATRGTARQALTTTVEDLRQESRHVGSEDPGYAVIDKTVVDLARQMATVRSCVWDTAVIYGPPARPGGPETVVSRSQSSITYEHDLYLEDGVWKIGAERELTRGPDGVNQCPPRPERSSSVSAPRSGSTP